MNIKTILSRYRQHIIVALLAIGVFCFWLFLYPFIPVMREASLLFLWNTDYMMERLAIPGGLAQYLGEGVTHLFLNPVNAAIIYAILFVAAQLLSKRLTLLPSHQTDNGSTTPQPCASSTLAITTKNAIASVA